MKFPTTPIAVICLGLMGAACASTPANASAWRFHPARCPDLVEDRLDRAESRRDERYDHGPLDRYEDRLDRRESRRDESVTVCPRSAWVYEGPVYHGKGHPPARPATVSVYYHPHKHYYYRKGPRGARVKIIVR